MAVINPTVALVVLNRLPSFFLGGIGWQKGSHRVVVKLEYLEFTPNRLGLKTLVRGLISSSWSDRSVIGPV